MAKETEEDYSYKVHRSIRKRQLIAGIPMLPFILIIGITMIILMDSKMKLVGIIPIAIILLYLIKEITKKDEYLVEIFLQSLIQPDILD